MKQQTGYHAYDGVPKRASLPPARRGQQKSNPPTSRNSGAYDPHFTSRTTTPSKAPSSSEWYDEEDEEKPEYRTRSPRSAVVYRRPYTHIEPVTRPEPEEFRRAQRRGLHPIVYLGLSMLIAAMFIAGYIYIPPAWQRHVDDVTYGYPRTYQTDANVGHGGISPILSSSNLHGTIEVMRKFCQQTLHGRPAALLYHREI